MTEGRSRAAEGCCEYAEVSQLMVVPVVTLRELLGGKGVHSIHFLYGESLFVCFRTSSFLHTKMQFEQVEMVVGTSTDATAHGLVS